MVRGRGPTSTRSQAGRRPHERSKGASRRAGRTPPTRSRHSTQRSSTPPPPPSAPWVPSSVARSSRPHHTTRTKRRDTAPLPPPARGIDSNVGPVGPRLRRSRIRPDRPGRAPRDRDRRGSTGRGCPGPWPSRAVIALGRAHVGEPAGSGRAAGEEHRTGTATEDGNGRGVRIATARTGRTGAGPARTSVGISGSPWPGPPWRGVGPSRRAVRRRALPAPAPARFVPSRG